MSQNTRNRFELARRSFLLRGAGGLGAVALTQFLGQPSRAGKKDAGGVLGETHFPAKVKRIVHLCMAGGPSQFESLDYKPELAKHHGEAFPASLTSGQQLAQLQNTELKTFGPQAKFAKHGQSGLEISEYFPEIAGLADKLCIVKSGFTEQINHDPAQAFMNSGSILKGRPSMGSWLLYGLGAETQNLPGFVVLVSASKAGGAQPVSARQWSAGFLPGRCAGVQFHTRGDAVHYIGNPEGVCQSTQRLVVDEVNRLNGMLAAERVDPEIATRIAQYEMAFAMQSSVPELTDFSKETPETLELYGVKTPGDGSFASNCLMARRLLERGVRMVQLYHRGWDHHGDLAKNMPQVAKETDRGCAAIMKDLERLGMLQDTLVLWSGEFGRTPMAQGNGRDHHINSMAFWLAGGGVKGGMSYGATDDFGYRAVEKPFSMHDLHATMLHLFGIDHERFTVKFQGLDARLTGVEPCKVVKEILA